MPSLNKTNITRLYIPSTKDDPDPDQRIWLDMKTKLLLSDMNTDSDNVIISTLEILSKIIVDWNLTISPTDDTKLPITVDNVDAFGGEYMDDVKFLSDWVGENLVRNTKGLTTEEKKTSSVTSIPVTENSQPII